MAGHATVLLKIADWSGRSGASAEHLYPLPWLAGCAVLCAIGLFLAFRSLDAPEPGPWDERASFALLAGVIGFWLGALMQDAGVRLPSSFSSFLN